MAAAVGFFTSDEQSCTPFLENAPMGCAKSGASLHCIADGVLFEVNILVESKK